MELEQSFINLMDTTLSAKGDYLISISEAHIRPVLENNPDALSLALRVLHSLQYEILATEINDNSGSITFCLRFMTNPHNLMHDVNELLQEYSQEEVRAHLPALVDESLEEPEWYTDLPRQLYFVEQNGQWIEDPERKYLDQIIDSFTNLPAFQLYDLDFYEEIANMGIEL